jgi:hypothetical protein
VDKKLLPAKTCVNILILAVDKKLLPAILYVKTN